MVTPLALLMCGGLFVISAQSSQGTDLRPGRYTNLASLVRAESNEYAALQAEVTRLGKEVADLTGQVDNAEVARLEAEALSLAGPAGLIEQRGAGLTVTLSDAPDENSQDSVYEQNRFVVHQQDIQGVVNAMWAGGATAITIQGQRVVSTTGIKCVGNSVQIHGVPYPQPYVVSAVGDPLALQAAIDADDYLDLYRADADNPQIQMGWLVEALREVVAPAYAGLLDISYATPTVG